MVYNFTIHAPYHYHLGLLIIQYTTPQYINSFAGLPQQTQTSEIFSCSKRIQRDVTPSSSFIFVSQSGSPHHMVLANPPVEFIKSLTSCIDKHVFVCAVRFCKALLYNAA